MSFLSLNTAATAYPVTVAEVKASGRIDADDEDASVAAYIATAVRSVEEMSGRALMPQTWDYKIHGVSGRDCVSLPLAPVASISAITYQDPEDATQSLNVANFYLFGDADKAKIQPKKLFAWPQAFDRPDAVTISFVAGYANASLVPEGLRHAVTLLATHWFEHRMPVSDKALPIPFAVEHLVNLERRGWVAA